MTISAKIAIAVAMLIAVAVVGWLVWAYLVPSSTIMYGAVSYIPGADVVMFPSTLDSTAIREGVELFISSR